MKTFLKIIFCVPFILLHHVNAHPIVESKQVKITNEGWELIGDLLIPESRQPLPAVLLLNQAGGNRAAYKEFANILAQKGIASLRLDLRGHGESTNLGSFLPGDKASMGFPWDTETDVSAAHEFLKSQPAIDAQKIGIVGASYSGEEMAEAGRMKEYAQAYVSLSPGSFSDESINKVDSSDTPWLIVIAKKDKYLQSHLVALQEISQKVELLIIPGAKHGTNIFEARPDLGERLAIWLSYKL